MSDRAPKNFNVLVYHDFENCRFESHEVPNISANILKALQAVHPDYVILGNILAIGNIDLPFFQRYSTVLESNGFQLIDVPPRRYECNYCDIVSNASGQNFHHQRVKDVADRKILQDMMVRLLQNSSIVNVMLISSDSDFTKPLKILNINGFTTFLAANTDLTRGTFKKVARYLFDWAEVKQGTAKPLGSRNITG